MPPEIPPPVPEDPPSPMEAPVPSPVKVSSHDAAAAARKKIAKQRLVVIAIVVVVLGLGVWYFQRSFALPLQKIVESVNVAGAPTSTPPPTFSAPTSSVKQVAKTVPKKTNVLTVAGIIEQTNMQRLQNGDLSPLAENATLDAIATLRIDDMFQQQYFAHVGPQGESALTIATSVGYAHLALGENLALGLYTGDEGVVDAWMKSPGHRENILDTHYTQIGVAVRKGTFEGESTWIAVQVFGRPASDCSVPNETLKASIDASGDKISAFAAQLQSLKDGIASSSLQSGPEYNAQVQSYNNLAAQYNDLVAQTKTAVATYDAEVSAFNQCLGE